MMSDCPDLKRRVASLRYAISAGETLPASVYTAWTQETGIEVLDAIGSTEMLHVFISGMPGRTRAGATGEVVPGYEAMIVDEQTMKPVPDGTPGLLAVRGPTGCRYFDLDERQQQYVRQGWNLPATSTSAMRMVTSPTNVATTISSSVARSISAARRSRAYY